MNKPCEQEKLLHEMRGDIKIILQRVSKLEVKSGLWGILGGIVAYVAIKYGDKV